MIVTSSSRVSSAYLPTVAHEAATLPLQLVAARREFNQPGDAVNVKAVVEGWIAGFIMLEDGRRQVVDLFLPGEILAPRVPQARWHIGLKALSQTRLSTAPVLVSARETDTQRSYVYHTNAILRLGCLSAYERLGHFLLEMFERVSGYRTDLNGKTEIEHRCGAPGGTPAGIMFPLSQEIMGDLLGLSAVHINRTLQQLRREGLVALSAKQLFLPQPDKLARLCHYNLSRSQGALFGRPVERAGLWD